MLDFLSLRPFGAPPSSEGGWALPRHSNESINCNLKGISGRLPKEERKKLAFRTVAGKPGVLYNVCIQVDYAYSTK